VCITKNGDSRDKFTTPQSIKAGPSIEVDIITSA
jgi:hypothetical protein